MLVVVVVGIVGDYILVQVDYVGECVVVVIVTYLKVGVARNM